MAAEPERAHMGGKPAAYAAAADMILEVQGRRFAAHSLVLRESPVLSDMLDAVAPEGGPSAPEGTAKCGPSAPMVLNLSGSDGDGEARLPEAVTADAMAALLEVVYNPWRPLLKPSGPAARVLLTEDDAERLIPVADFLGMRSVLELCDVGLAARLAQIFSWGHSHDWMGSELECPIDQRWLEYGERYSLPHVAAAALDSVLRNLTRVGFRSNHVQARVVRLYKSVSGVVGKIIAEELTAHIGSLSASVSPATPYLPQQARIASSYRPNMESVIARLKLEMDPKVVA